MATIARNPKRRKWEIDFSNRSKDRQIAHIEGKSETVAPLGYVDTRTFQEPTGARDANTDLIEKKSWDVALGPMKQIPMNLFIMWMAGSTISIFPIMMVGMMFIRPIQALMSIQQTFKSIDGAHATLQKAVYTLGNLIGLALAVYKCQVMGLLPTHPSDWLAFVQPQERMEWSGGGAAL